MRFALPFTIIFTAFLCYNYAFGFYLFPMLLPDMRPELGLSYGFVGTVTASAQVGFIAASLLTALLAAKLGSSHVVIGSTLLCGLCLLTIGLTSNVLVLAVMLIAMGALAASVWIPMVAIVARHIPESRRGTILGIFSSAGAFGAVLNAVAVPWITSEAGWRSAWLAAGIATCATVGVGYILLWQMGLFAADRCSGDTPKGLTVSTLRRVMSRHVVLAWTVIFLGSAVCLPFQTFLSVAIRDEKGLSTTISSSTWMIIGLVGTFGGGLMGALADKVGTNKALLATALLTMLASGMIWLGHGSGAIMAGGALYGLSYYAIFGLVPAYISRTVSQGEATIVFSFANVMAGLGGAAGNLLGGWLVALSGHLSAIYMACCLGATLLLAAVLLLPLESRLSAVKQGST